MNIREIKRQGRHYWRVLKWLMTSYYRQERKAFWIIQILMGLAVLFSVSWLLGLIAGLNYLSDTSYLNQYNVSFLNSFFSLSPAIWVVLLSLAGILGAAISFWSYHIGVQSVIRFQLKNIKNIFSTLQDDENHRWVKVVEDEPLAKTNQIIKLSVQMTGLVARRLSRMLIPFMTFVIAFIALLKLDAYLLSFMIPLAFLYMIGLYFINRHAARTHVVMSGLSKKTQKSLGELIKSILSRQISDQGIADKKLDDTGYKDFSDYRYKRRLAEIHVTWLNTLFLVLGSAVIILSVDFSDTANFDWMHLLYFIVALRYAGSGLQQMASATVSFSRFLPEVELVYALLSGETKQFEKNQNKIKEDYPGCVFFLSHQFSECLIAEALLKNFYTENTVIPLDDFSQYIELENSDQNVWVYSDKPSQFKQTVRKYADRINWVLIETNGKLTTYEHTRKFLEAFEPSQFQKAKAQSTMLDDEDM